MSAQVSAQLWRKRVRHDIRHELGTIIMLLSAVRVADDVGPGSLRHVDAMLGETRRLDHLLRRLEDDDDATTPAERIRVDTLIGEIVEHAGLVHPLAWNATPTWARIDPLALCRAVRHILAHACDAAARVDVTVLGDPTAIVQIDDDAPGLARPALGAVHDLVHRHEVTLELAPSPLGGARVRLLLPG